MYEVRNGLGQIDTFDTLQEARDRVNQLRGITWANVFPVFQ